MTQEEKQLLLKDLCARLPYGFKYQVQYGDTSVRDVEKFILDDEYSLFDAWTVHEIKPYLRPMSSMTDEERENYRKAFDKDFAILGDSIDSLIAYKYSDGMTVRDKPLFNEIDWLNENMFDFRGLIPMGLALEAPEDMYKTE